MPPGVSFTSFATHSNQQIAYGTVWMDFDSNSLENYGSGRLVEDRRADGLFGTNNFYLTTNGNMALNQIGHIVKPVGQDLETSINEARILANTIMHVSQRQQCQVCQSAQDGNNEVHFTHRIYHAEELAKIGHPNHAFTYPADGCYMLAANITLPDNWTPVENFRGHFHADNYGSSSGQLTNYRVTLGANNAPLFANTSGVRGEYTSSTSAGWNLGTELDKGVPNVVNSGGGRTTGIARVSGQLHLLLGGKAQDWANHIVAIKGGDGVDYWARTNIDGKYVVSNIPTTGIMDARVYKTATYAPNMEATGTGIPQNGTMRVNVQPSFWNTGETTAIYIKSVTPLPINDVAVYDGQDAMMVNGGIMYESKVTDVTWQVKFPGGNDWVAVASSGLKYDIVSPIFHADGDNSKTVVSLKIKDTCILNSGLNVRAVFKTPDGDTVDTYSIGVAGAMGKLAVANWPMRVVSPKATEVWVDATSTFTSSVETKAGTGSGLSVQWQIRRWDADQWVNVANYAAINDGVTKIQVTTNAGVATGDAKYPVKTTTTLKIINTPEAVNNMYVRAVYTYQGGHTAHGANTVATGNHSAKITVKQPKLGVEWVSGQAGRVGMSFENPLLCDAGNPLATSAAVYEADVVYLPGAQETSEGSPTYDVSWRYKTTSDALPIAWNNQTAQTVANKLGVPVPTWSIETGQPVRGADGIYRIRTKLTISNVHWKFYSDDCFISFSAQANTHYKTNPYKTVTAETTRMPLLVDYKVGVKWNAGQFTRMGDHTVWTYPGATADSVAGVKTLLIEFDLTTGIKIDSRDALVINGAPAGMWASFVSPQYALFVSDTPVSAEIIEGFLRSNVSIKSYDTTSHPKVMVYINAEKNLGKSMGRSAVSTFLEGFEALESGVSIAPMYAGNVQIIWSASQFFVGGSAVAYSSATNAGYYQWQLDQSNGGGYQDLPGENRPTLALSSLDGSMNRWKFRVVVGDSAADPAKVISNELRLAYGFENISIPGESYIQSTNPKEFPFGNPITIPAQYAPFVTRVTFQYEAVSDHNNGDVYYGALGYPAGEEFLWPQLFGSYARGEIDRTLTSGRGLEEVKARVGNNASSVNYQASMRVWDVRIWGVSDFNPGTGHVIQRGPHDAWDITTIFHDPIKSADVIAVATSKSKVYDGVESMATIKLTDRNGILTDNQLAQLLKRGTVAYSSGATIPGDQSYGSGCVNVGTYTATFTPAAADLMHFSANTAIDIVGRRTTFEITKRPVYLYSYNNKEYDGTDAATVKNVLFKAYSSTNTTGVVPTDVGKVSVSPTNFAGNFGGVVNQTNGQQIPITRNSNVNISLAGARAFNYMIAGEDYTGAITARKLNVHSLYQDPGDPPKNPRNIKQYDGTTSAIIKDILIDGILPGDAVWVDNDRYTGRYAAANAGERLNADGTTKANRYNNLDEIIITRTGALSLINNPNNNYTISRESYSGAIYRRTIDTLVTSQSSVYGQAYTPAYTTAPRYSTSETGQDKHELIVDAMVASDILTIDVAKSRFVFDREITETTPAGVYPVTYEGLNETNYAVLSNYVLRQHDGAINVMPRELIIRVDGGYEKLYGDPNTDFGVLYEHFVNGDTPESALMGILKFFTQCKEDSPVRYDANKNIDSYGVTAYGLSCKLNENGYKNYEILYESGDIKVLPAPLHIKADDKSRPQRTENPIFTVTYTGLKVGDGPEDLDVQPTITCLADFYSPMGEYDIIPSDAASGNYAITYEKGILTIYDGADVVVTKAANKAEVEQYGTITYTVMVENSGERPLFDILVEDIMTETVGKIVPVASDKYAYIGDGKFTIDYMAIGDVVEIKFTYFVEQLDPGGSTITDHMHVTESLSPGEWDSNEVDVYIIVNRDIDFDKSVDVKFVQAGDTATYTLTVTNTGNVPLAGITIEDAMTPHESKFQVVPSADFSVWKDPARERRIFSLRTINPAETIKIVYTLTISSADANKKMVIQNFAIADVPDEGEHPGFTREDEERIFTGMDKIPAMVKTSNTVYAEVGDTVTYTVVYTNNTNDTLTSIIVQDKQVPKRSGVAILPGDGYSYNPNNGHITLDDLGAGERVIIQLQYTIQQQDTNGHDQIGDFIEHNGNMGVLSNTCYVAIP